MNVSPVLSLSVGTNFNVCGDGACHIAILPQIYQVRQRVFHGLLVSSAGRELGAGLDGSD